MTSLCAVITLSLAPAQGATLASYGPKGPVETFIPFNDRSVVEFAVTATSVDIDSFVFQGFPFSNLTTAEIREDSSPGVGVNFGLTLASATSISGQTLDFSGFTLNAGDYWLYLEYSDGEQNRTTERHEASSEVMNGIDLDDYFTSNSVIGWSGSSGDRPVITISGTVVPEPSSTALLGLGTISLLLRRRR